MDITKIYKCKNFSIVSPLSHELLCSAGFDFYASPISLNDNHHLLTQIDFHFSNVKKHLLPHFNRPGKENIPSIVIKHQMKHCQKKNPIPLHNKSGNPDIIS